MQKTIEHDIKKAIVTQDIIPVTTKSHGKINIQPTKIENGLVFCRVKSVYKVGDGSYNTDITINITDITQVGALLGG